MKRIATRASLFYSMLCLGLLSLVTGFILYFWPHGQRAGRLIFLRLSKTGWSEWHAYLSVVAVVIVVVHLLENRHGVGVYVRSTLGRA